MKKAVFLILALCLVFSLAACGGSSDSVVGKWTGTVDMRDTLVSEVPDIVKKIRQLLADK